MSSAGTSTRVVRTAVVRVATLSAVLAALLHAPALWHGFLNWDDNRFITANPLFAAGGWTYVRAALTQVQFDAYHPLHLLSYLPDRWLWPGSAAGFHALSLALFALDALLLFQLARRHASLAAAAAAVLLFAAHPLTVEPVEWISARKDLLATAFFAGALLIEDARDAESPRASGLGVALFVAALLSKSAALCLPPILWCWLVWMRRAPARAAAWRAAPYALIALVEAIAVLVIWRAHQMIPQRPTTALIDVPATIATYARRMVWPADLAAIYPAAMPAAVVAAVLAVAGAAIAIARWRRLPGAARFALLAFLFALAPVANLVPVVFRFADRYAFLALAVLVPPAAVGLDALARRGRRARALPLVVVAVAAAAVALELGTLRLGAAWGDSRKLWAHTTSAQPDAFLARLKYGETLREQHEWTRASAEYRQSVRLRPDSPLGYVGLFFLYATRAEADGKIAPGTAAGWLRELGAAIDDRRRFASLIQRVPRAACLECADTLLLLDLRRWPRPDDVLLESARAALAEGAPDVALVLLSQARDPSSPAWQTLAAEAQRAGK
jgi:hypothetical protein